MMNCRRRAQTAAALFHQRCYRASTIATASTSKLPGSLSFYLNQQQPRTRHRAFTAAQQQSCPSFLLSFPSFTHNGPSPHRQPRHQRCRRAFSTRKPPCPFATLGVPKTSSYAEVKSAFFRLALKHHPDVSSSSSSDASDGDGSKSDGKKDAEKAKHEGIKAFVKSRAAFEAIAEGEDGAAVLREESYHCESTSSSGHRSSSNTRAMSEAEFEAWFHEQTGHAVPFDLSIRHLDPAVLREVADVTEGMSPGGLDRGGMWQFAANMREKARRGEMPPLRVAEGEEKAGGGARRRRRKR